MYSKKDVLVAMCIFIGVFIGFRISPIRTVTDSRFVMMFSEQLLWHHSLSLPAQAFPELQSHQPGKVYRPRVELPYQLVQRGERFYNIYPPGNVILPLPYVAVANAVGLSATDPSGVYDKRGDVHMQAGLAALLMAGLCAITFLTARLFLPAEWSVLIALANGFGTQVWSTASRALWSHTWAIFILSIVIWIIVRAEARSKPIPAILLATCLSWIYFVRPILALSILAVTFYVIIYHPRAGIRLCITGALWLAAFLAYSRYVFAEPVPSYYQQAGFRRGAELWDAMACNLVSPARGLIVYVPILLFVFYLLARYWSCVHKRLFWLGAPAIIAHVVVVSAMVGCHGGHCYGPRYMTDIVPWCALLGIISVEARLRWKKEHPDAATWMRKGVEVAVAAVLLVCSIAINASGAVWPGGSRWNMSPTNIDEDLNRVWDWKHPQFLGADRPDRHSPDR